MCVLTAVHGALTGEHVLAVFEDDSDASTGRIRGLTGWEDAKVAAPADARTYRLLYPVVLEDALRADHLSLYGYGRKTSPFKEELLKAQGAVFLRARSQDNVTRTSLPSMPTPRTFPENLVTGALSAAASVSTSCPLISPSGKATVWKLT